MNSASASEPPPMRAQAAISSAELESMRRRSIAVLDSVAAALEAAGQQKQTLLAEVHAAQQTLQALAHEREVALHSRAALAAEIAALEHQRDELTSIASKGSAVNGAGTSPLLQRIARSSAVEASEHEDAAARAPIATVAAEGLLTATPQSGVELQLPTAPVVIRTRRAFREHFVVANPVHPGFGNVVTALFIALLLAMALLLSPVSQVFGGLQLLAVTSGSMAPSIPTGSMVGVRPVAASDLKMGDVITFVSLAAPDVLVTHRIVSLEVRDGQTILSTKGDANDALDALSAPASRAVGRVEFALPILGNVMLWLGSPMAKIVSVGLAILALALSVASIQRSTRHLLVAH